MRSCAALLVLLVLAAAARAVDWIDQPGAEIHFQAAEAGWNSLFRALGDKGNVVAAFTEQRSFAVRKQPVEVSGELRLARDRGLSLHYGDRTMIIDAQGVLLRDRRGRTRAVPPEDGAPAANALLLPVLSFDQPVLQQAFVIRGARAGDRWRLDFTPRTAAADASAGTGRIVVHGRDEQVARIELQPKAGLRIAIELGQPRTGVQFTPDELRRFFR